MCCKAIPLSFDSTTIATIEQIDVLWIRGRAIVRAFEVANPILSARTQFPLVATTWKTPIFAVFSASLPVWSIVLVKPRINVSGKPEVCLGEQVGQGGDVVFGGNADQVGIHPAVDGNQAESGLCQCGTECLQLGLGGLGRFTGGGDSDTALFGHVLDQFKAFVFFPVKQRDGVFVSQQVDQGEDALCRPAFFVVGKKSFVQAFACRGGGASGKDGVQCDAILLQGSRRGFGLGSSRDSCRQGRFSPSQQSGEKFFLPLGKEVAGFAAAGTEEFKLGAFGGGFDARRGVEHEFAEGIVAQHDLKADVDHAFFSAAFGAPRAFGCFELHTLRAAVGKGYEAWGVAICDGAVGFHGGR